MRRLLTILALLTGLAALAIASSPAAPSPTTAFVLAGGGWGHGVGMSQWGAYGQAKAGRDYRAILGHYYRGTALGAVPASVPQRVRVLIAERAASLAISSAAPIEVIDANGKRYELPAQVALDGKLRLPVGPGGKPKALRGPLRLLPTKGAQLHYSGKAFRGAFGVSHTGDALQLVNIVDLEAYLLGVVPGEMPRGWPLEALKAQAVAARTYAVRRLVTGRSFDLYSDWRSQVYYGAGYEAPDTTRAVRETKGQILTYDGKPAQVFYFSSSGGRTVSALDAFGSDVPYLLAVDDPWDEVSPHHRWPSRLLTAGQAATLFGLAEAMADASIVAGMPGRPAVLRLTTAGGGTSELRLADVRSRLGLKSTQFTVGVLRLDQPAPAAKGKTTVLTGVARSLDGVVLERRGAGGAWSLVERLAPTASGAFRVELKPEKTAVYRLSADGLAGPPVTLRVAA